MNFFDRRRCGTTLIELLVVIGIMGILLSLLLPALQMARESADETVCKSNVQQLRYAMLNFASTFKRLPPPNRWTVDLLPYLEERPLANALKGVDPVSVPAAQFMPRIFACTAQGDVKSFLSDTPVSHYMLVIEATAERRSDRIKWTIADRPVDLPSGKLPPWYVGPEILPSDFQRLVSDGRGPHRGGVFFPVGD